MFHTEVYTQRAVSDLRAAIGRYSAVTDAMQTARLDELTPALDPISQAARHVLAPAYTQTISAYNMAIEIQSMARAPDADLSQRLRHSLRLVRACVSGLCETMTECIL